ncbi:probable blue pigment (indigoidine) exporter [Micromonospora auratinigra]|uniref:Probable blue pigment (Indigoidine) exporter n=1 Tax=Micromonospora auratinigra TaxID=261654 RepID=A0A1A8ZTC0_9ACTN|nr:probable blue pigment (indigoidine) exporter [Micromonospora auratinigra]
MPRHWTDVLPTAAAPATWGTTYLVTAELLPADRPLWSGALRALPAGLVLLAVTRRRPTGQWWWRSVTLGALNIGAFFPLLFVAAYRLPGGTAAVLGAAQPLLVAALGVALLGERPGRLPLLAALTAPLGVALVVLRPDAGLDPLGVAAGLAGTAAMAAGLVLTRRWGRPAGVGILAATSWQLVAGGLLILPVAAAVEGAPPALDTPALLGYAWLGLVGTALAYVLWFRGAARLPATRVSVLGALSPLTAAALGWLALDQALGPVQLAGFAIAVGAMVLGQAGRPGQPASSRGNSTGPSSPSDSAPAGSSAAAARGSTNRCAAAGPAAYDWSSSQRTSSTVQPSPARPAISRTSRTPTRVSSS